MNPRGTVSAVCVMTSLVPLTRDFRRYDTVLGRRAKHGHDTMHGHDTIIKRRGLRSA
jgi:hypothetical protein